MHRNKTERRCPQCQAQDLEQDHLSQKGSQWPILFGRVLFKKRKLLAFACKKCGFVFLEVGEREEE